MLRDFTILEMGNVPAMTTGDDIDFIVKVNDFSLCSLLILCFEYMGCNVMVSGREILLLSF